ncbi:hypothetical protein E7744_14710 (plasmid) [Citricoccus sp. SGAir0253]|uniref:hypothetical protein n=1 Tax=Citricoccus sp. SGAir0253 TaxID=2567881 RepID=UPI0010CCFFA7|nr:hypothetical protein [Citricoccus sp. SGAir0253]QCU79572.1 hypothetical protein E7744_14710 [Citricoccus sp. SGAir0253]
MNHEPTTVQDMYDLARSHAYAFSRRPLHDARIKRPYGDPVHAADIVAALPRLTASLRYTTKTYLLYATGAGAAQLTGFRHRLDRLEAALQNLPLRAAGTPVPEVAAACRYLNVGADLVRTTMPYAAIDADGTRAQAVDTALGEYADILHTLTGALHDKLRPATRTLAPTALLQGLDAVLTGAAQLRDLPADPDLRQITELAVAPARSATVHAALARWLTEAAPALGTRPENLTGATTTLDWDTSRQRIPTSSNTKPAQFDARGSSYLLRGITQTALLVNRAGMQLVKAAHDHAHLTGPEATGALQAMNRAGKAWATTAGHWDATVKIPGAGPTTGRHHLEGTLAATRALNTVLRPIAEGNPDTLAAMTGTPRDLQRTIALVQHLDATLDRVAFAHHRLAGRLADSGQLLAPATARTAGHLPGRVGRTTWAPVTSTDARVQTLLDTAGTLARAAEHSTQATGTLRLDAPTRRGTHTHTAGTLQIPRAGRASTRPAAAGLDR